MGKIMHLGTSSSGGGEVIDNLLSTASSLALSANQGRILNEKIEGISGGDEWDQTQAYSIDDYAIYQNKLYQCIANTTAGIVPTNTTYWKPISIKELNTNLVNKTTPTYANIKDYCSKGAYAPSDMNIYTAQLRKYGGFADIYIHLTSNNGFSTDAQSVLDINWSAIGVSMPFNNMPQTGIANNYNTPNIFAQSGFNSNWVFNTDGSVIIRPTSGSKNVMIHFTTILGW